MRLLIHGMQSSGATAFARMLAERPGCLAMTDIANQFAARASPRRWISSPRP